MDASLIVADANKQRSIPGADRRRLPQISDEEAEGRLGSHVIGKKERAHVALRARLAG